MNIREKATRVPKDLQKKAEEHYLKIIEINPSKESFIWLEEFFIEYLSDQYIKRGVLNCANERTMLKNVIKDCVEKIWV